MGRLTFTFKEAKLLYLDFKRRYQLIVDGFNAPSAIIENTKRMVVNASNQGTFKNLIQSYLSGSEIDTTNNTSIHSIKKQIDLYYFIEDKSNKCAQYVKGHNSDLEQYSLHIKPAIGFFRWVFSSGEEKIFAEKAYMYLKDIIETDEFLDCEKDAKTIKEAARIGVDVSNNTEIYSKWIKEYLKKTISEVRKDKVVEKLINNYGDLIDIVTVANSIISSYKQNIISAVDSLVDEQVDEIAKSLPIDKISSYRKGLRIKPLRDAGIDNIYKLHKKSCLNIPNIGYETASEIIGYCDRCYKEIKKSVRVKLSYDSQTTASTVLVKYIYRYRQLLDIQKEIREIFSPIKEWLEQSIASLIEYGSGVVWPFLTNEDKIEFKKAYDFVDNFVNGDEGYKIIEKCDEIKTNLAIDRAMAWEDFRCNSIEYFNLIEKLCPNVLGQGNSRSYGLPNLLAEEIEKEPLYLDGLKCTLRKYQEWGVKYALHQRKVLLGDEMGLGKTIQAIATMVSLRNHQGATRFVVVCPASVLTNWYREILKHSDLVPIRVHGSYARYFANRWKEKGGVAIVTYESAKYINFYDSNERIQELIVDEAHYVKNPEALRTKQVKRLISYSERVLFMTGTALENKVDEMIELIANLNWQMIPTIKRLTFMSDAPAFREKIAPVYYRRKRDDVLTELPELIENEEWCPLTQEEEAKYAETVFSGNYMAVRRVSWNIDNIKESSKMKRMLEIIKDVKDEGRKIIVFSYFLDTLNVIKEVLKDDAVDIINGSVPPIKRQEIIDRFDSAPAGTVLPAQIVSGGTGLNIQSASVVIICEPQFKPSTENQAISRAYRMGQSRNVLVFRLLCEGSIDEKITELLKAKQRIFDEFADKSVAGEKINEIDESMIVDIIQQESDRLAKKGYSKGQYSQHPSIEKLESLEKKPYADLLDMKYQEIVDYLLKLHGPAHYDYFLTETCRSKNNKVVRSSEGLYCHHIDEDKFINLSDPRHAIQHSFDYQKANRLVYCDILEHLILHIKIAEEHTTANENNEQLGLGGIFNFMCPTINDCLKGKIFRNEYQIITQCLVQSHFDDYVAILKYLMGVLEDKYPKYAEAYKYFLYLDSDGTIVEVVRDAL